MDWRLKALLLPASATPLGYPVYQSLQPLSALRSGFDLWSGFTGHEPEQLARIGLRYVCRPQQPC